MRSSCEPSLPRADGRPEFQSVPILGEPGEKSSPRRVTPVKTGAGSSVFVTIFLPGSRPAPGRRLDTGFRRYDASSRYMSSLVKMNPVSGVVFNIQRCSLHDGPGIRTTVFLKGCPLRCFWCQNPESQSGGPEILLDRRKCTLCGACRDACPNGAVRPRGGANRYSTGATAAGAGTASPSARTKPGPSPGKG